MPAKLTTTIGNIEIKVTNPTNRQIVKDFYEYLQNIDTSENYQYLNNELTKLNQKITKAGICISTFQIAHLPPLGGTICKD